MTTMEPGYTCEECGIYFGRHDDYMAHRWSSGKHPLRPQKGLMETVLRIMNEKDGDDEAPG